MKKILSTLMVVILIGAIGYFAYDYFYKGAVSYVIIDINPSVQLTLDEDEEVVEVIPLNEDADVLMSDLDLIGLPVNDAVDAILDGATEAGYIDEYGEENNVYVSALSENEVVRTGLEKRAAERIKTRLEKRKVYALVERRSVTDDIKAEADEYGISYGKMLLIERAVRVNDDLKKEDLTALSVREIQQNIKEAVKTRHEERDLEVDEAKEYYRQQKDIIINEARERIENLKDEIREENKNMINNAAPTDRDKVINDLLEERKKRIKKAVEDRKPNTNIENSTNR